MPEQRLKGHEINLNAKIFTFYSEVMNPNKPTTMWRRKLSWSLKRVTCTIHSSVWASGFWDGANSSGKSDASCTRAQQQHSKWGQQSESECGKSWVFHQECQHISLWRRKRRWCWGRIKWLRVSPLYIQLFTMNWSDTVYKNSVTSGCWIFFHSETQVQTTFNNVSIHSEIADCLLITHIN